MCAGWRVLEEQKQERRENSLGLDCEDPGCLGGSGLVDAFFRDFL